MGSPVLQYTPTVSPGLSRGFRLGSNRTPAGSVSTGAAGRGEQRFKPVAVQTPSRATKEGARRDSNPEPEAHESDALSTRPQDVY